MAAKVTRKMANIPNAIEDQRILAFADADADYKAAEAARKAARKDIDDTFGEKMEKAERGTSILHDSRFSLMTIEKKATGSRLDKALVAIELVKRFKISMADATALLADCSKEGNDSITVRCMKKNV